MHRWGLVPLLRDDFGYVWLPEPRVAIDDSRPSRRTLSPETVQRIRDLSTAGLTLREVGRAVGISHETVRAVLAAA
jgi:hypothetical protein